MQNGNPKGWVVLSFTCFLLGVVSWLPNFITGFGHNFWLLTLIINPLGALFGFLGKIKLVTILNGIMAASFFLFMFIGYILTAITGGQP